MPKLSGAVFAALCIMLGSLAAQAATLGNISGDVKINRGNGYQTVTKPVTVNAGDKVLVGPDSAAQISYSNGMVMPLSSGIRTVATVTEAVATTTTQAAGAAAAGAAGAGGTAAGAGAVAAGGLAGAAAGLGVSTAVLVGVGVAAAVGLGVAVSEATKDDDASN